MASPPTTICLIRDVQEQMLKIVGEVVERYGHHPAFGGVAIQLTGDGYAQLPGLEWGLDDSTIERFERRYANSTRCELNARSKHFAARHMALTSPNSPHFDAWRAWRARQIADFYARLAAVVRGNSDRQLLLTTEKLFDHPQIAQRIRPNLPMEPIESRVASTMLDLGLDRQLLEKIPGIVFCPTRYVEPMSPLPERAVDLELNDAFVRWRQQPNSAAHPPPGYITAHCNGGWLRSMPTAAPSAWPARCSSRASRCRMARPRGSRICKPCWSATRPCSSMAAICCLSVRKKCCGASARSSPNCPRQLRCPKSRSNP